MSDQEPKDRARDWLKNEVKEHRPPPSLEEIRRRMGWKLVTEDRKKLNK